MVSPASGSQPATPERSHAAGRSWTDELRGLPVAVVGLTAVVGGTVLQLVAFVGVVWFRATLRGTVYSLDFSGFGARTQRGLAYAYFAYGAWVLLVITLGLGIAACWRWRWARAFQVTGAIVAVLGAALTIVAVLVFAHQSDSAPFEVASNYTVGVYLAALGLVAVALGCVAGGAGGPARD